MFNHLKKLFSTIYEFDEKKEHMQKTYHYFLLPDGTIIGIHKDDIQKRDLEMLNALATPFHEKRPEPTVLEKRWAHFFEGKESLAPTDEEIRYIYFYFSPNQHLEASLFKTTLQQFFSDSISLIWLTPYRGILIEPINKEETVISYQQIRETIMAELLLDPTFLVGPTIADQHMYRETYTFLVNLASAVLPSSREKVITYYEALLYSALKQTDAAFMEQATEILLGDFANDKNLLQTLQVFMQSNLNVSEASKQLYMHRNSLIYRLDKFQEKTGLDVRQFEQAVPVYLLLLANLYKTTN